MNSQISGQKTSIMKETEYLGMLMDAHLTFENHMDTVKLKLNIANYINPVLLRTRYMPSLNLTWIWMSISGRNTNTSLKKSKTSLYEL